MVSLQLSGMPRSSAVSGRSPPVKCHCRPFSDAAFASCERPSVSSSRESADCSCCAVKIAFNSSAAFWSLEVANDTEGISMAADKTAANVLLAGIVLLRKFIGPPVWRILGIRCIVSS